MDNTHHLAVQEVPAFRDFRIRDPRYFVICFQALFRENPLHFVIFLKKNAKKNFFSGFFFEKLGIFESKYGFFFLPYSYQSDFSPPLSPAFRENSCTQAKVSTN